jgi:hypothetical protein
LPPAESPLLLIRLRRFRLDILRAMSANYIKLSQYNHIIWQCLKLYLPPHTILSCVYRTDEDQLAIIVDRANRQGYKFSKPPKLSDTSSWFGAWQKINTKANPVARPGHSTHRLGIAYDLAGPDRGDSKSCIF